MRQVINAILYIVVTGAQWRLLPKDYPKWQTVYHYFRRWRDDGTLDRLHAALRDRARAEAGRDPDPSAAILDSQSVKTSEKGGRAASTLARRFRDASATLSSIPSD